MSNGPHARASTAGEGQKFLPLSIDADITLERTAESPARLLMRITWATIKNSHTRKPPGAQMDPIGIAIAREGYRIQSQVLGVPDRLGLFMPGDHPGKLAYEGMRFSFLVTAHFYFLLYACFVIPTVLWYAR